MWDVLRDRPFRHLFAAQVISLFGTGMTTVALALLAYQLAEGQAGQVLGVALALKMIAYVSIAPLAGAVAQRFSRRRMLVCLDLLRAAIVGVLPFVETVGQVYLLVFLLNAGSAAFTPLFQATIPDLLTDEARYTHALSLSRMAYDLENLLSPVVAALLLSVVSFNLLFLLNGVTFVISALLVISVLLPPPSTSLVAPGGQGDRWWHAFSYGIRLYLQTPRLRGLLALNFAVAAVGAMQIVNTVVYVRAHLGLEESLVALAYAAVGAGSLVAASLVPRLLERVPERTLMLAGSALMSCVLLLGLGQPQYAGLLVIWCLLGLGASLVQTPAGRLLRRSCEERERPALYAAQFSLSHACWLVTYPLAGWLGARGDLNAAFAVLAMLALLATLLAGRLWPAREAAGRSDSSPVPPQPHRQAQEACPPDENSH